MKFEIYSYALSLRYSVFFHFPARRSPCSSASTSSAETCAYSGHFGGMDEWENPAKNTQVCGNHFGSVDDWDSPVKNTLVTRSDPSAIPVCMRWRAFNREVLVKVSLSEHYNWYCCVKVTNCNSLSGILLQ